jgi:CDP-glucose 4,6-dehydratase
VTGHTGFKGSWLAYWLSKLGAEVTGVSLAPEASPNLFQLLKTSHLSKSIIADVRDLGSLVSVATSSDPEIVFHLAAQSLVKEGYRSPLDTFSTNLMGTANILEMARRVGAVKVMIMVTTDKVYKNRESIYPYRENDELGGYDPYSSSKAASELIIDSYRQSFLNAKSISVSSARAGNVIGGGDWSRDRLIPDAVRAWEMGSPLCIRNPASVRPWQHVLEPLAAYITLAEKSYENPLLAGSYNFGPNPGDAASVGEVIDIAKCAFPNALVNYVNNESLKEHEAGILILENVKARERLGVVPRLSLKDSVMQTMAWYKHLGAGANARGLCDSDIVNYESLF